jgi:hypothetical protein
MEGAHCTFLDWCPLGLVCHGAAADKDICFPPSAVGEACARDRDCVSDDYCDEGVCESAKDVGAACDRDGECVSRAEVCEGERCFQDPVVCHSVSGTCEFAGEDGEECGVDADCSLGRFCATTLDPSVCRETLDNGEPCTNHEQCGDFRFCNDGRCVEPSCEG